jgi:RimJ/RimL family protein N-acetyltransferase
MGVNEVAQNRYRQCGFQEAGRIRNGFRYYDRYVDDVTMVKYFE